MSLLDRAIAFTLPAVPKPIVGYFSKRYIAGPDMEDAFRAGRELERLGACATFDILGEFITTPEEARANTDAYVDLVQKIAAGGFESRKVSVKLTALGLLLDRQLCLDNVRRLMGVTRDTAGFLRIDMEDSACTDRTLEIYKSVRREFTGRHVGIVVQSRLRRTLADVDDLTTEPASFRLCKGIYLEPRPIAFTDAELIRRNFTLVLDRMFERGAYVGIATHDEILVWEAMRLIRKHGLGRDRYEFQMLLGVDEQLRNIILQEGQRLRVYVPYGRQWYAYSVRRLRENPQIAGYGFRAIFKKA
jgi:proline dehydrogenase